MTLHECLDYLREAASDPLLPPHIDRYTCEECGERYLFDAEAGTYGVDV